MAGYIRQDVSNEIANGNVIDADIFDSEFDAIASAFNTSTGHTHDGSSADGAPITVVGPAQDISVTSIAVIPKTDNTYDLGSASNEWKDLYIDGVANIDSLVADAGTVAGAAITTLSNTQTLTNKTINLGSNTLVATSAQLAAALTDETGTGSAVFSNAPALVSPALTGVPTAPTAAAGTNTTQLATTAHVFAERTNAATLTNKTLTSPTITGGSISGITDLAIADGGTGASTAAGALINFGLTATAVEINTLDGITASVAELNKLDGVTATTAELNILDGVTATTAELNKLDGLTATTTELNYVDGVTSNIQTQLNGKQATLGFTPVQQGGGAGQGTNKVYIGWGGEGNLKAQVDVTDVGKIYHGSAPGNAPTYACRAWVNFDGGGTVAIRGAGNVSSITDNGTGDYTVNFSIWMPDVAYCVVTTGSNDPGDSTYRNTTNANRANFATSSFRIFSQGVNQNNSAKEDSGNINVAVFR